MVANNQKTILKKKNSVLLIIMFALTTFSLYLALMFATISA